MAAGATTEMAPSKRGANRTECTMAELREADRRRAELEAKKRVLEIDHRRYATLIQAMWRGYCVRDALRTEQEERAYLAVMFACMKIQRRFRNHLQLKAEREIVEREERQMLWAVWVIQSVARCFGPRAELAARQAARDAQVRALLMERSAIVIQKYWRGHLQRRLALWLREVDARRHLQSARRHLVGGASQEMGAAAAAADADQPTAVAAEAQPSWSSEDEPEQEEDVVEDAQATAEVRRQQHMAAASKARAKLQALRAKGRGR